MKTIWLVQLQYHGSSWNPSPVISKIVCACDSEEAAHKVGQDLAWMYNHPNYGFQEHTAGIIREIWSYAPAYRYAVMEHQGEWI